MITPRTVYLDAAASTPLAPEALEAMLAALGSPGNPGAAHSAGYAAAQKVERAREQVATLMHVGPASVVFTASATEANNLAMRGLGASERSAVVTSAVEHQSVLATLEDLATRGRPTTVIPVMTTGEIDMDALRSAVCAETLLVSIQAANNETGVIQPIHEIADIAHSAGALLHTDASQLMAWGEEPSLQYCDLITVSSHKMHGPQGAAALIVKPAARGFLRAQITGGGQERGLRAGTLNVAAIAGFGAAAELSQSSGADAARHTVELRNQLLNDLTDGIGDIFPVGLPTAHRLPGILNVAVGTSNPDGVESEALLARVPNLAASTGSACRAGVPGPSPVLLAMGMSEWQAERSIRFSLSRYTTSRDIDHATQSIVSSYHDLAQFMGWNKNEERFVK